MNEFGLQLEEAICDHAVCDAFISACVCRSNATRLPLGAQSGNVSTLDFAAASPRFCHQVSWTGIYAGPTMQVPFTNLLCLCRMSLRIAGKSGNVLIWMPFPMRHATYV